MAEDWISINLNPGTLEKAERFIKAFGPLAVPGIQRAMNRSLKGVRTDAARAVRGVYNVKAKQVRDSFTIYGAGKGGSAHGGMHGGRLQASAVSRGRRIPMAAFPTNPRDTRRTRLPKVGARVKITRQGGFKTIPGAFIGTSRKGKKTVYVRQGKDRHKLRSLAGPSIPQMIGAAGHPDIYTEIRNNAVSRYEKNFDHEMNRLLKRLNVK